jgi:hypothetical protein
VATLKQANRERLLEAASRVAQTYGDGNDVEVDEHETTEIHRSGNRGFWVQGWVYVDMEELRCNR